MRSALSSLSKTTNCVFPAVELLPDADPSTPDRAQACGGANSGHSGIGCFGANQSAASERQICPMKAGFGIGLSRHPIRSRTGAVTVAGRSAIKGEPH
jgi:hypothetical protein